MNFDSQLTSKADHSPPSSDSTSSHELATQAARSAARSGSPVTALPAAIARSDNLFLRILPYGFNSSSYKLVIASSTLPSVGTGTAALALFLDFVFFGDIGHCCTRIIRITVRQHLGIFLTICKLHLIRCPGLNFAP